MDICRREALLGGNVGSRAFGQRLPLPVPGRREVVLQASTAGQKSLANDSHCHLLHHRAIWLLYLAPDSTLGTNSNELRKGRLVVLPTVSGCVGRIVRFRRLVR